MWSKFFSSTPEHLQPTASLVKSTVLGSKVDGTARTYLGGLRRWKRWASSSVSQRILGRPKVKKDPVTPEMLKALAQSRTTDKSPSLSDLRSVALFRFSELCHIKACDVKFFPSYVSIFLESSKTVTGRGSLSHEVRSMDARWLHLLLLQGQGCQ